MSSRIFISYRRRDAASYTIGLAEILRATYGPDRVFIDTDSIRAGSAWPDALETALDEAAVVIVVIGPRWLRAANEHGRRLLDDADDWVRREIERALQRGVTIVPVLIEGAAMPAPDALPPSLAPLTSRQAIRVHADSWSRDHAALHQVVENAGVNRMHPAAEYPVPHVRPTPLDEATLASIGRCVHGWTVTTRHNARARGGTARELTRAFTFESFRAAMTFMADAAGYFDRVEHHPRWENLWRTVTVHLTTWDIGHVPSTYDLEAAEYLNQLVESGPRDDAEIETNGDRTPDGPPSVS